LVDGPSSVQFNHNLNNNLTKSQHGQNGQNGQNGQHGKKEHVSPRTTQHPAQHQKTVQEEKRYSSRAMWFNGGYLCSFKAALSCRAKYFFRRLYRFLPMKPRQTRVMLLADVCRSAKLQ
jgi:hypothetical protein